jgi:DNA repair protein RadA/Sms
MKTKEQLKSQSWSESNATRTPILLSEIQQGKRERLLTPDNELNRVMGGGIVPGSLTLIGGQPGIGKSTLLLQTVLKLNAKVLYVSGEESEEQIKLRADRIADKQNECYILTNINLSEILKEARRLMPDLIVFDSIQTLSSPHIESTPGSISQIRECTGEIQRFSKETQIPVFIIGHINKEGSIAGPKLLEHIVDTVLQFEGDLHYNYRMLRTIKNRFGSTDELGIYEMGAKGLREVENPSELLISQHDDHLSGSSISATVEGLRPILIETQALVSTAVYGNPQRTVNGFDTRRLQMLLAVLEKRGGFSFGQYDVFVNLAGGIKVNDPAIDLSVVASLISSAKEIPIPSTFCFAGEVGLSGEIRAVSRLEQRIQEASRLGFTKIFISKYASTDLRKDKLAIELVRLGTIEDLISALLNE